MTYSSPSSVGLAQACPKLEYIIIIINLQLIGFLQVTTLKLLIIILDHELYVRTYVYG